MSQWREVQKEKKKYLKKIKPRKYVGIKLFTILFSLILVAIVGGVIFVYKYIDKKIPEAIKVAEEIDTSRYDSRYTSTLYYKNPETDEWEVLEELRTGQDKQWIEYNNINPYLINAAIAIEDQQFWTHNGVNYFRSAQAFYNYVIRNQSVTAGGSTITQQLIKNLTGNDEVSRERKIMEIIEAVYFEKTHTKQQIMELYLNEIYFGNSCQGIYMASHKYFAKDPENLDLAEAACIIGITNNPTQYNPFTKEDNCTFRGAVIVERMHDQGLISQNEMDTALKKLGYYFELDEEEDPVFHRLDAGGTIVFEDGTLLIEETNHIYSWYTDAVIEAVIDELMEHFGCTRQKASDLLFAGGLKVYTCLNPYIQWAVDSVYTEEANVVLNEHINENIDYAPQSAITIVDNASGAVVALSGGVGEKEGNRLFNLAVDAARPSGSSIKPLSAYTPAYELGLINDKTVIMDSPFKKDENGKDWPVNAYGKYYNQNQTMKTAISISTNTVAVKVCDMVGIDESYDWLVNKWKLKSIVPADKVLPALALGGFTYGVSTYEMAGAYSTFPRKGIFIEPYLYSSIVDRNGNIVTEHGTEKERTQIFSEETANSMDSNLQAVVNSPNGTGTPAALTGITVAGKTGTTTSDYDVWFDGYTADYTASVWVGYTDMIAIKNSYPNPAAQLWHNVMARIYGIQ